MQIDVLLYDGFDELDALGPYEVLANARFDTALVSLDGARQVTGSHGATVVATSALRGGDVLVVPGGGWNDRSPRGARAEAAGNAMPAALRAAHDAGTTLASVCTGGMLLASAGLLAGRPATTHHGAIDDLRAAGAEVIDGARVVDDGDILSAGGVTSGIDLALWLVERELGAEIAGLIAREMEHDRRGPVHQARHNVLK
jgi:transcriptional regulator GlxA family with amidase domain